jgi:cysteine desulfurase
MNSKNNIIYFNTNRSTRADEAVLKSMTSFHEKPLPDREKALMDATQSMCRLLNCDASELLFTKGTTESIELALNAAFELNRERKPHFITTVTEHPAVTNTCKQLASKGAEITFLKVNPEGLIDVAELERSIQPNTVLVSIMATNNETGVIQALEDISGVCKKNGLLFFSDASQYVGKMRTDMDDLGMDMLAFGAHKMYGPEAIGCLYVKKNASDVFEQIRKKYSNDLKPSLIIGFGMAAELFIKNYWELNTHISKLKNYFEHQLLDIEGLRINGTTRHRLYNTSNLTFPETYPVHRLLTEFDFAHNQNKPSHVLQAMGLAPDEIKNSYRFSFGKNNTLDEVKLVVEKIKSLHVSDLE